MTNNLEILKGSLIAAPHFFVAAKLLIWGSRYIQLKPEDSCLSAKKAAKIGLASMGLLCSMGASILFDYSMAKFALIAIASPVSTPASLGFLSLGLVLFSVATKMNVFRDVKNTGFFDKAPKNPLDEDFKRIF